tara:strand:+ start:2206 stop:2409 length:204 start_codon:yes stop_codon:yes gene_type:complete
MNINQAQKIRVTYLSSLLGTVLIVIGLGILPLFVINSGLLAFMGAGIVFISATYQFLLSRQDKISLE